MKAKVVVAWPTVAVPIVALAGCGGEDEEGLSKQEYVARADAVCAKANKRETAMRPGGLGWHYGPKFSDADFLSQFIAIGERAKTGRRQ